VRCFWPSAHLASSPLGRPTHPCTLGVTFAIGSPDTFSGVRVIASTRRRDASCGLATSTLVAESASATRSSKKSAAYAILRLIERDAVAIARGRVARVEGSAGPCERLVCGRGARCPHTQVRVSSALATTLLRHGVTTKDTNNRAIHRLSPDTLTPSRKPATSPSPSYQSTPRPVCQDVLKSPSSRGSSSSVCVASGRSEPRTRSAPTTTTATRLLLRQGRRRRPDQDGR